MHRSIYIYIYIHLYIYIHFMYVYIYMNLYICEIYIYITAGITYLVEAMGSVCVHACKCMYTCIYLYTCTCTCTCLNRLFFYCWYNHVSCRNEVNACSFKSKHICIIHTCIHQHTRTWMNHYSTVYTCLIETTSMGWRRLVGSFKL